MRKKFITLLTVTALGLGVLTGCGSGRGTDNTSASQADTAKSVEITNVSYDPTRELYAAYNELFATHWKEEKGQDISVVQSHGGSGKQALEVANGLQADVVTLALEGDVDAVKDAGLIEEGYTSEFPLDSSPYTSTIVFLVRKGNPKNIQDWDDLLKDDVGVITPNPKTSGGARWNYLAAWYYFESQGESEDEIVVPSVSILCQPTVAVVDEVVDKRGTREVATEYLNYLYSDEAQKLEAEWYYRPSNDEILKQFEYAGGSNTITELPEDGKWIITNVDLTDISHFGGWTEASEKHFKDGGVFDSIYEEK